MTIYYSSNLEVRRNVGSTQRSRYQLVIIGQRTRSEPYLCEIYQLEEVVHENFRPEKNQEAQKVGGSRKPYNLGPDNSEALEDSICVRLLRVYKISTLLILIQKHQSDDLSAHQIRWYRMAPTDILYVQHTTLGGVIDCHVVGSSTGSRLTSHLLAEQRHLSRGCNMLTTRTN